MGVWGAGEEADGFAHGGLEEAAVRGVGEAVGGEDLAQGEEYGEGSVGIVSAGNGRCGSGVWKGGGGGANLFLKAMS